MKKLSYLYYIFLIALLPLYVCFCLFSQNLFYAVSVRRPLKENFVCSITCKAEWCTLWFDKIHGELAVLYMFRPFRVQYIPVKRIQDAHVHIDHGNWDANTVAAVYCMLTIQGKQYKTMMLSRGRYSMYTMDGLGGKVSRESQALTDSIMETKKRIQERS